MAVDWLNNFIVPIIQLVVYFVFFGGIAFFILRACYRIYNKQTRWWLKYKMPFLKKPYEEDDLSLCIQAYDLEMNEMKLKMFLLKKDISSLRIKELLYIYRQFLKTQKGGNQNGRQFKGNDRKVETNPKF